MYIFTPFMKHLLDDDLIQIPHILHKHIQNRRRFNYLTLHKAELQLPTILGISSSADHYLY